MKKSIVLVEDHSIVRVGICSVLDQLENFYVMNSYSLGLEALHSIKENQPDIAIIDLNLPDLPGDLIIQDLFLNGFQTKIIVMSRQKYVPQIAHLLSLGVSGYVVKDYAAEELVEALNKVSQGSRFISPSVKDILDKMGLLKEEDENQNQQTLKDPLTQRETEVAKLLCLGADSKEVASRLGISPTTVRVHTKNLLAKFGLPFLKDFTKLSKFLF